MDEFTSAKSCLKKSRTDFFNILLVCHSKEPEATQNLGAKTKECDPYLAPSLGLDPSAQHSIFAILQKLSLRSE